MLRLLGGILLILVAVQSGPIGNIAHVDPVQLDQLLQRYSLDKCLPVLALAAKAEMELLREALDIYESNMTSVPEKVANFKTLLQNNSLPSSDEIGADLLEMLLLTDYTHPVEIRAAQFRQATEITDPDPTDDEDDKLIRQTAAALPLRINDKVFKDLEKFNGTVTAKFFQQLLRRHLLTEAYLKSDQETKNQMVTGVMICYAKMIGHVKIV